MFTLTSKLTGAAVTTGLVVGGLLGAAPAHAATTGGTDTTFAITAGGLSITVPASKAFAGVSTGASSVSGQLGAVAVADSRGLLVNSWTATVNTTTFVTGTSTANETVAKTNVAYASGATSSTSGLGTFVPTLIPTAVGTGVTGASWTGAAGNSTASWDPTMTFTLLSSQVAGTYSGTITHSVA